MTNKQTTEKDLLVPFTVVERMMEEVDKVFTTLHTVDKALEKVTVQLEHHEGTQKEDLEHIKDELRRIKEVIHGTPSGDIPGLDQKVSDLRATVDRLDSFKQDWEAAYGMTASSRKAQEQREKEDRYRRYREVAAIIGAVAVIVTTAITVFNSCDWSIQRMSDPYTERKESDK